MNIYLAGKIYKVYSTNPEAEGKFYIGSTTQNKLATRLAQHRFNFRLGKKSGLCEAMKAYGEGTFKIEKVEDYPCLRKDILNAREGYWIRHFDSIKNGFNKYIAGRDRTQYYQDNREKIKEQNLKYYHEHKHETEEEKKERQKKGTRRWKTCQSMNTENVDTCYVINEEGGKEPIPNEAIPSL